MYKFLYGRTTLENRILGYFGNLTLCEKQEILLLSQCMVPTGTGKLGKMGRYFPVMEKSGNLLQILENQTRNVCWKTEKKTGKVGEFCQAVIMETLQIWYHTLNRKVTLKNTGKLWKYWKSQGEVREICQSEQVGTMRWVPTPHISVIKILLLSITWNLFFRFRP